MEDQTLESLSLLTGMNATTISKGFKERGLHVRPRSCGQIVEKVVSGFAVNRGTDSRDPGMRKAPSKTQATGKRRRSLSVAGGRKRP